MSLPHYNASHPRKMQLTWLKPQSLEMVIKLTLEFHYLVAAYMWIGPQN